MGFQLMTALLGRDERAASCRPCSEKCMSNPEPNRVEDDPIKTISLHEKDLLEAARVLGQLANAIGRHADPALVPPIGDDPSRDDLITRARIVLNSRRVRGRYFSPAIFGEPAWDILLVLYITDVAGDRQTIGKLAEWISAPPSTVVRWAGYLEREKLIERHPHPTDRRTMFIRLSDKGRAGLDSYLRALPA